MEEPSFRMTKRIFRIKQFFLDSQYLLKHLLSLLMSVHKQVPKRESNEERNMVFLSALKPWKMKSLVTNTHAESRWGENQN